MKIKVSFNVDVDYEFWAFTFGVPYADVRKDAQAYFEKITWAALALDEFGLPRDRPQVSASEALEVLRATTVGMWPHQRDRSTWTAPEGRPGPVRQPTRKR